MGQIFRELKIDFSMGRYIVMDVKQFDSKSRFVKISCLDCGNPVQLSPNECFAFVRYKKPDSFDVFNSCVISNDGAIIFELSEQMLATVGMSCVDVMIVDITKSNINNSAIIFDKNGEIINNNCPILSTMSFYIHVLPRPVDGKEIESSNEFSALNDLLIKATTDYEYIVTTTKEYMEKAHQSELNAAASAADAKQSELNAAASAADAKQSADNAHQSENNAKDSEDKAKQSELNAKQSETNAKASEIAAKNSENIATQKAAEASISQAEAKKSELNAKQSELNAKNSEEKAKISELNAKDSENKAKASEIAAKNSEDVAIQKATEAMAAQKEAKKSADKAKQSEINAKQSENIAIQKAADALASQKAAKESEVFAKQYMDNAKDYSDLSKSYAVGHTGIRQNEDIDNSEYYYNQIKQMIVGLSGVIQPMGTISFEQLHEKEKVSGHMYNISNQFISDDSFKDGGGLIYPSGTNVYCTADGYWDCYAGSMYPKEYIDKLEERIAMLENIIESNDIRLISYLIDHEGSIFYTFDGFDLIATNKIKREGEK